MADIDDLLRKQKEKLERSTVHSRKRIVRTGPTRPWQENLPQYQETKAQTTTEANPRSVRGQTEDKPGTQLRTNRGQTEVTKNETEDKPGTQLRTYLRSNRGQTEVKSRPKPRTKQTVSSIDGLQREILILIFNHCKRLRAKQTPPIAVEHITKNCNTTYHGARKALQRLEQKGVLKRSEFKVGRSGWTKYEIPDVTYQELIQNETESQLRPIRGQIEGKPGTQLRTEPRPPPPSSSSKDLELNKLTNTGDTEILADLPPGWNEIDTGSLIAIRFGRPQLVQLARLRTLNIQQVQESINAFAFDLEVNGKGREINGHALNYFMGILRKGPYAPATNYEPPEVRQMRLYLEAKEREQKARAELESRLETVEFDKWISNLAEEERRRLVPPTDFAKPGSQGHNVQLKEYFRENVWPGQRERLLRGEQSLETQT